MLVVSLFELSRDGLVTVQGRTALDLLLRQLDGDPVVLEFVTAPGAGAGKSAPVCP